MGKDLEAGVLLTHRESHRITLSDMCGSRPACVHLQVCTCMYVQTHVLTRKPKRMDASLSDLKWPTNVALGSSDRKEQVYCY